MESIQADIIQHLRSRAFLGKEITLDPGESITRAGIIDSIGLIQLIDYIEDRYHIQVPVDLVTPENFDTLEAIERLILRLMSEQS